MKICILTSSYPVDLNGEDISGLFARDFALELVGRGHEVTVITPRRNNNVSRDTQINIIAFKWLFGQNKLASLRLSSFMDVVRICSVILFGQYNVLKFLKKEKVDFVVAMWAVPAGFWAYIANFFTKTPYGVWCLGSDIWIYGRNNKTKWIIRNILRRSRVAYADGEGLRTEIEKLSGKKCYFLPTSRNLDVTNTSAVDPYNNGRKNFLFVGRYHSSKGADVLIDAINLIPNTLHGTLNFELYGNGEDRLVLENKVKEYGLTNVSINGFADPNKLVSLMKYAHFVIIPSRFDSIPVVFSEALQCKVPMITSDVGDLKFLIENYKIGFVFEKENTAQLAELIVKASQQDRANFTDGLDRALEIFDVKKAANKLVTDFSNERLNYDR